MCRPTVEQALAGLVVELFELFELGGPDRASIVRLDRAPFLGASTETFLGIVDGRIAWSSGSRAALPRELWTVQAIDPVAPAPWVVSDVEHRTAFQATPQETRRTRYERLGMVCAPVDFRTTWTLEAFPDSAKSTHVTVGDVSIGTALAPAPPTGALADALRAAWDRAVIDVEGRTLTDEMRAELANAVGARFYLFAHRDLAARSPFDRAFAGATLSGDPGRIGIEFAVFSAVEIRDGLPTVLERSWGSRRSLELKRLGKALIPATITTDAETIRATWTDLGDGWTYQKELVFELVFGPDWGPEKIHLTKLAVE